MSLLQKAKARPDQVKKVWSTARTLGWKAAMEKVKNRLESPSSWATARPGRSSRWMRATPGHRVGDRVACGGAECAFHAELVAVPDLLASPVPDGVDGLAGASLATTLTSISMQAVRQCGCATEGSRAGDGMPGLSWDNSPPVFWRPADARVMGVDFVSSRLEIAKLMGAERVVHPGQTKVEDAVREWTEGVGVDAVLLCVGGKSPAPAEQAITCLRDRRHHGDRGHLRCHPGVEDGLHKGHQVPYSRSYGPGRYDPQYEWGGRDYPVGYVRWTENRNFEAALHLMRSVH